jgi:hypothetical protein
MYFFGGCSEHKEQYDGKYLTIMMSVIPVIQEKKYINTQQLILLELLPVHPVFLQSDLLFTYL